MGNIKEGKYRPIEKSDELRRQLEKLATDDPKLKAHLIESQAFRPIRKEVWKMKSADDIEHVSEALKTSLETLEIPYIYCGINVVDLSLQPPMVHYHTAARKGEWIDAGQGQHSDQVLQIWQRGVPAYRPDLEAEDIYSEWEDLKNSYDYPIRSVLDIPFSHGTLAVNSSETNAFSHYHIELLGEVAQVLSEGFMRMEDLRALEQRNRELEGEIDERKQTEKQLLAYQIQLRALTSDLVLTEEKERRDIATELHDGIGQTLALIQIKMGELRAAATSTPFSEALKEIYQLIDQMAQQSQSLTFELSPPVLYELGFDAAVEWLARQMRRQYDLQVVVEDDGSLKALDEDMRVMLFRALRELLVNVTKHAQANLVTISTWREEDQVFVAVADDGIGFAPAQLGAYKYSTSGFGLFNLQERITHLNGSVQIKSAPGHGTRVLLGSPLKGDG